ncbi:MAG TPA: LPS assembly lipoprotein LptE [Thauera sp.]|uniref:LPS-assembly lipoprotein LptE n=1 Tax=Thauera sp. TaxID=1905334 RepID=UPI002BE1D9C3|nr:LPS assembly lipoprotein LptE [Thauera sp.]HRP23710.1 LPS assembly lipoprotein LptE [Thauera sp.]HRP67017.1 LPS assembly lipoprotein LptE [Thauera sp.]
MPDRRPLNHADDAGVRSADLSPGLPRRRLLLAGGGLGALLLSGCGFRLRGPQALDFATVHINTPAQTELGAQLRRQIATSGTTTVVEDAAAAEARLQILANSRGREILSLTGAGKVREYQLTQTLRFQLIDKDGRSLLPPTNLSARREYTFDDSQVLGKEQEEALLYRDMQADLVQQLMRRLAVVSRAD